MGLASDDSEFDRRFLLEIMRGRRGGGGGEGVVGTPGVAIDLPCRACIFVENGWLDVQILGMVVDSIGLIQKYHIPSRCPSGKMENAEKPDGFCLWFSFAVETLSGEWMQLRLVARFPYIYLKKAERMQDREESSELLALREQTVFCSGTKIVDIIGTICTPSLSPDDMSSTPHRPFQSGVR